MSDALGELLSAAADPEPIGSLRLWWARHRSVAERAATPIDVALLGGFVADRLGYAFASGYQAAGAAMFGGEPSAGPFALCATEAGGAHPRAIDTTLTVAPDGHAVLDGTKRMVTLGTLAERLLVVCSEGTTAPGRKALRVVAIGRRRDGVTISERSIGDIIPEIPHAEIRLERVAVAHDEVLPGDGYERYLKPFRTVEDVHVHAALTGWLIQIARRSGWPRAETEALAAHAVALAAIARAEPSAAATHVALAGLLEAGRRFLDRSEPLWDRVDAPTRDCWERDRALLSVAGKARARRLEVAWQRLGSVTER